MKRKERKRMEFLKKGYYDHMQKINDNFEELENATNEFRMRCVEEIGKLMNEDKELKKLELEAQAVWRKNHEHKS